MTESNAIALVEEQSPAGLSMIDGPDPQAAMHYAAEVSKVITSVLKPGNGYIEMQGRKHIEAAGWQTIAAMTGHTCEVEYSRMVDGLEDSGLHAWEARAIVRDQNGRVVSSGESMASPTERVKKRDGSVAPPPWSREEFSIRSMAQTRAMGRAMAARMRYVVQLAGFQGAPAEEMGDVEREQEALKVARGRWKVLRDALKISDKTLKSVIDQPHELSDDEYFANAAHALGWNAAMEQSNPPEKAEDVEGEVVDEPEGQQAIEAEDNPRSAPGDA